MTPQQLAALEQRLATLQQQRALLDQPSPSVQGGTSNSLQALEARLAALKEKRAQLDKEAAPSEYSYWDRIKQLGGGVKTGAERLGSSMSFADPDIFSNYAVSPDEQIKDRIALNKNLEHQREEKLKSLDAPGRILHRTGEGIIDFLAPPFGMVGMKNAAHTAKPLYGVGKHLLKTGATGASVGGLSGVLQEGGMNPLAADLVSGTLNPGVIGTGKLIKKAGQYVLAPREQKAARALNKIYTRKGREIGETRPAHEAFNVPAALEELNPITSPTEAGTRLRETLTHELKTRKDLREAKTKPLYKAVEENPSGLPTPETNELMDTLLQSNYGDTRKAVQNVKQELAYSHRRLTPQERKNKEVVDTFMNNPYFTQNPQSIERLKKQYPYRQFQPTAHEVDKIIRQVIDPKLKTADDSLRRELTAIKESLLKETTSVPELKKAREAYTEFSKPVNRIDKHPLLKLSVEKDPYGKYYTFGDSDLPQKVIDPSLKSVHHAEHLLTEIKKHKNTLSATRGYIQGNIIDAITDGYGKVSHEKLQAWKRKNPGAFILDPSLETKLKNLSNSQYLVNQARLKINNSSLKDTFTHFGLTRAAQWLPSFMGKDKIVELLSLKLADDIQGKDELIMKLIQSPQFQQLLDTKPRQLSKMEKLVKALTPAMRNALVTSMRGHGHGED